MKTGRLADRTVDVGDAAATAADDMVMVVADPGLVAGHRPGWLDLANESGLGERAEDVVDRLMGDVGQALADRADDLVGVGVGMVDQGVEHGKSLAGHPQADTAEQLVGFSGSGHVMTVASFLELIKIKLPVVGRLAAASCTLTAPTSCPQIGAMVETTADIRYIPPTGPTWQDPWPMYAALREHDPVHHVDRDDYWVLTRHADVFAAVRDHETFSSAAGLTTTYGELEAIGLADNPPMVMTDPPEHTAFRRLVSRGFTPRQVESLEPTVREFVVERLDALRADGGGDIVARLFKPLPSMVVAHYLGVPEADRAKFDVWTDAIVTANVSSGAGEGAAAAAELAGYFSGLVDRRRSDPADDVVSHLVAAGEGESTDGLMRILAFAFTMVAGGNDTTTGLLGAGLPLLAEAPDQRALVLDDVPAAVEELLRLTSPVQGLARTATRDVTLHDTTIPAGRKVLLCYAAANRDPRAYGVDAEELDVRRDPRQILTFAHGAHHCLGAAAARMTARVTLTELLARIPDFTVDPDSITWAPGSYVRRPLSVELNVID